MKYIIAIVMLAISINANAQQLKEKNWYVTLDKDPETAWTFTPSKSNPSLNFGFRCSVNKQADWFLVNPAAADKMEGGTKGITKFQVDRSVVYEAEGVTSKGMIHLDLSEDAMRSILDGNNLKIKVGDGYHNFSLIGATAAVFAVMDKCEAGSTAGFLPPENDGFVEPRAAANQY